MTDTTELDWASEAGAFTTFTDVVKLSDEELAVLGPGSGLVVYPIWSEYSEAEQELARRIAFRGLIIRDLIGYPTEDTLRQSQSADPNASMQIEVREDLSNLLLLRNGAGAVVAGARTIAEGQNFLYAHIANEVAILETVENDGIHAFAFGPADQLAGVLRGAFIHPEAVDGSGQSYSLTAGEPAPQALLDRLGEAHLRSDVVLRHVDDSHPSLIGFMSGPAGSWLIRAEQGGDGRVTAVPATVAEMGQALDRLVDQGLAAAASVAASS